MWLLIHSPQWVIAGTLGLQWARSALRPLLAVLYMTVFCGASPVGVGLGMALTSPAQQEGGNLAVLLVLQVSSSYLTE